MVQEDDLQETLQTLGPLYYNCYLHSSSMDVINTFYFGKIGREEMVVLKIEEVEYENDAGKSILAPAVVFSCKAMLECIDKVEDIDHPCGMSDTTFKLMREGWVLACIGVKGMRRSSNGSMKGTVYPIVLVLAPTETGQIYHMAYETIETVAMKVYKKKFVFKTMSMDRYVRFPLSDLLITNMPCI